MEAVPAARRDGRASADAPRPSSPLAGLRDLVPDDYFHAARPFRRSAIGQREPRSRLHCRQPITLRLQMPHARRAHFRSSDRPRGLANCRVTPARIALRPRYLLYASPIADGPRDAGSADADLSCRRSIAIITPPLMAIAHGTARLAIYQSLLSSRPQPHRASSPGR